MHIYIGNLAADVTESDLRSIFEKHGTVRAATIARTKATGESEGYGFVDMPVKSEARNATEALRGTELKGNQLRVKILKPGDEFHQHALNLHAAGAQGLRNAAVGVKMRSTVPYRGSGAIRRGGRRGG